MLKPFIIITSLECFPKNNRDGVIKRYIDKNAGRARSQKGLEETVIGPRKIVIRNVTKLKSRDQGTKTKTFQGKPFEDNGKLA